MNKLLITILVATAIIAVALLLCLFLHKIGFLKTPYDVVACFGRIGLEASAALLLAIGEEFDLYKYISVCNVILAIGTFTCAFLLVKSNKYFEDKEIIDATKLDDGMGE